VVEWGYFISKHQHSKQPPRTPLCYSDALLTYAYLLVEKEDYDKAIRIIDTGLRINPMHIDLLFEKVSIYRKQKRHHESFQLSLQAFDIAYKKIDIARCYRDLGYYFMETKNWDAAICCYSLGGLWDKTPMTGSNMFYITQQTGMIPDETYYKDNLNGILQQNGIPLHPNPLWIEVAFLIGNKMASSNSIEEAKFCYSVAYDLTGDETFHERIFELNRKLQ
jgi:tetratricopeptide (TPR) repeat protein